MSLQLVGYKIRIFLRQFQNDVGNRSNWMVVFLLCFFLIQGYQSCFFFFIGEIELFYKNNKELLFYQVSSFRLIKENKFVFVVFLYVVIILYRLFFYVIEQYFLKVFKDVCR